MYTIATAMHKHKQMS